MGKIKALVLLYIVVIFCFFCQCQEVNQELKEQETNSELISDTRSDTNQNIQSPQLRSQKSYMRVSLNEDSILNIAPPVDTKKQVPEQNNPVQSTPLAQKDSMNKNNKNLTIDVSAPPSQKVIVEGEKEKESASEQIQDRQNTSSQKNVPQKQQVKRKQVSGEDKKVNPPSQQAPVQNRPKIPIISRPQASFVRQNQVSQNERLQKERLIQQWRYKQQELANKRAQIIQKRQQQLNRIQQQRKKMAEKYRPPMVDNPSLVKTYPEIRKGPEVPTARQPSQVNNNIPVPIPIPGPTPEPIPEKQISSFYCGRQIYQSRRGALPQTPNARERLVSTVYGFNMYVDSRDYMVSNSITVSGTWQPGYINLIGHLVKPGYKVLNLGSQSGLEALIMGKIIGGTGRLFIFEPYSFSNSLITKNIQLNNLQAITTIYKYGASDQKTTATIRISYSNTGGSEIVPTQLVPKADKTKNPYYYQGFNEIQEVQIDRVDALLPKDVQLDFALLDVEKMEIKALKGMKQIIQRSPNLVIMTQWQYGQNPRRNQKETIQFLNYMIQRGYKIYSYTGGNIINCSVGQFHQFERKQDLLGINFIDVFFIPKGYFLPQ